MAPKSTASPNSSTARRRARRCGAITEARKEFLLNQSEEDVVEEDEVLRKLGKRMTKTTITMSLTGRRSDG